MDRALATDQEVLGSTLAGAPNKLFFFPFNSNIGSIAAVYKLSYNFVITYTLNIVKEPGLDKNATSLPASGLNP